MAPVNITIATYGYDHVRDLLLGKVHTEGFTVTGLELQFEDVVHRMADFKEFDVAEFSVGKYVSMISRGDNSFVAIPVFPSFVPRLSALYVNPAAPVEKPEDLRGKRIAMPEWVQTASIYMRGWLSDHVGIPLKDVEWYQGGVNDPGRVEDSQIELPAGVKVQSVKDRTLTEMLVAKEIDVLFSARAPRHFLEESPNIARMFPNYQFEEERYCKATGIVPIMHTFVMRREIADRHPWLPLSLFRAFEVAKKNAIDRLFDATATRVPLLWGYHFAERTKSIFGDDYWPYGVSKNRRTLDAFLRYAYEQGVAARRLSPEELFAPSALAELRV